MQSGRQRMKRSAGLFALGLLVLAALPAVARGQFIYVSSADGVVSQVTMAGSVSVFVSAASLSGPSGLTTDVAGNLYISNSSGASVARVTPAGVVNTYTATGLSDPYGLAFASDGTLYVANNGNGRVRKIGPGTTTGGTSSQLAVVGGFPNGIAVSSSGDIYVSDGQSSILKVTPAGVVSTFATGMVGPWQMAFDAAGDLYVANPGAQAGEGFVAKISPAGVTTVFLSGLNDSRGLTFDNSGNLYVSTYSDGSIYRVDAQGTVTTFATGFNGAMYLAFVPAAVPEPATWLLLSASAGGIAWRRWRRTRT